jgi:cell division septum initiation protein DivIVA
MSLTPVDVCNVAFSKAPIGRPSYHKDEVDDLVNLVEAALVRLIEENNDLRNHVEHLKAFRPMKESTRSSMRKRACRGSDHNAQVSTMLGVAQNIADQLTDAANAEACIMLSQAQVKCEHLLSDAKLIARNIVNGARTRADTILHDARTAAETLERQSRENAASLEQDATRKRIEILDALSWEKRLLENKIDELRAFVQEYGTRMTSYAQSELRKLDESESDTPISQVRTSGRQVCALP